MSSAAATAPEDALDARARSIIDLERISSTPASQDDGRRSQGGLKASEHTSLLRGQDAARVLGASDGGTIVGSDEPFEADWDKGTWWTKPSVSRASSIGGQ